MIRRISLDSRYIIGIDLGTTSCALSYIDTLELDKGVRVLDIPQWESEGALLAADNLPSFCYLPPKNACKKGEFVLPFVSYSEDQIESKVIGSYARKQMVLTPDRVIHAAKSWLCHRGVDSHERFLPWHSDTLIGDQRLSPIQVSSFFLKHLKAVWDDKIADANDAYEFNRQRIVITVPASFDELASQYTLSAAQIAAYNMENVTLLEEPLAAFYHWQHSLQVDTGYDFKAFNKSASAKVREILCPDNESVKTVLICDVGGGTTDFSLLEVDGRGESLEISRIAVSEHILLGGDNIDLKIAYFLENKLKQEQKIESLHSHQWAALVGEARNLKEKSLFCDLDHANGDLHVGIASTGSSLFAGGVSTSVKPSQIQRIIADGFFPSCGRNEGSKNRGSGLKEWGLPYAKDSAITRHLASFLSGRAVDAVLFTGGSLIPELLRGTLAKQIALWQKKPALALSNDSMHLAVAKGAAWYGASLHFKQGKIKSGYPRNLFVEVAVGGSKSRQLMSVLPKGFEGGEKITLDQRNVKVLLGQPVTFQMFYSLTSKPFKAGDLVEKSEIQDLGKMPPLQTKLELPKSNKKRKHKPRELLVNLELGLTETGLLTIDCVAKEKQDGFVDGHKWSLNFNVQETAINKQYDANDNFVLKTSKEFHYSDAYKQIEDKVVKVYGKANPDKLQVNPNKLGRELETSIGLARDQWNLEHLRGIWQTLKEGETRRCRSQAHETTWLNLAGFCLRPGYGDSLDRFRMDEVWQAYERGLSFPKGKQVQSQWWILWRRVAGGLNKGRQEKLFAKIAPLLRKGEGDPEMFMLAGSLELVSVNKKVQLGSSLVKQIKARKPEYLGQKVWALGRIASRIPLYGGPENIVRPAFVEAWIDSLSELDFTGPQYQDALHFFVQSGRLIGDRELDLSASYRQKVLSLMPHFKLGSRYIDQLQEVKPLDLAGHNRLFGESLPAGFVI